MSPGDIVYIRDSGHLHYGRPFIVHKVEGPGRIVMYERGAAKDRAGQPLRSWHWPESRLMPEAEWKLMHAMKGIQR